MSICVLGYPLSRAVALLEEAGEAVRVEEISCRKGVAGEDRRVVRQRAETNGAQGNRCIVLTYAAFQTVSE